MTIGILGGGQLARMLALAAHALGLRCRVYDHKADACAGDVAELFVGDFADEAALARFADGLDAVTYEFENVPDVAAKLLSERVPTWPPPVALTAAQDRLNEKRLFQKLDIPVAAFAPVDSREALAAALAQVGAPAVLKTRRFGYDGKGQAVLRAARDADAAWEAIGQAPAILEALVPFDRELSILAVRSVDNDHREYPLVQNRHAGGILRESLAPAPDVSTALQQTAADYADRVLDELGYVGVLAIELFAVGDELLANEMAPRVHNSGHWTIEGAATSQFENHIRAVAGLPLGNAAAIGHSVMLNLIGVLPTATDLLGVGCAHVHRYGKTPRPGRKVGHVTLWDASADAVRHAADALRPLLETQPCR